DVFLRDFVEARRLRNRVAAIVVERLRLHDQRADAIDRAFADFAAKLLLPWTKRISARDRIYDHEADIVPVARVFCARIAEADEEQHLPLLTSRFGEGGRALLLLVLLFRRSAFGRCGAFGGIRRRRYFGFSLAADDRRDGEVAIADHRTRAVRQRDRRNVDRVADVAASEIDDDLFRNLARLHLQLEGVTPDVARAAALQAGRSFVV